MTQDKPDYVCMYVCMYVCNAFLLKGSLLLLLLLLLSLLLLLLLNEDQITSDSPNARDQSAFCAFHTFLVEIQTKVGYIQSCDDACVIITGVENSTLKWSASIFYFTNDGG